MNWENLKKGKYYKFSFREGYLLIKYFSKDTYVDFVNIWFTKKIGFGMIPCSNFYFNNKWAACITLSNNPNISIINISEKYFYKIIRKCAESKRS